VICSGKPDTRFVSAVTEWVVWCVYCPYRCPREQRLAAASGHASESWLCSTVRGGIVTWLLEDAWRMPRDGRSGHERATR